MTESNQAYAVEPLAEAGREYLLRPDCIYLNHGSFGARPRPVFDAYQHWQRELELQPVEFLARRLPELLHEARAKLARYVGATTENLIFVPNVTHGMNIIARSLRLHPGDEVLGTNHEYGAVERTWRFHAAQAGIVYRTQDVTLPVTNTETVIEELWRGVTERTRVLVISHISSPTALRFPVAEICRRARAEGILVIIDGAHAPGQIDLALDNLGADFYVGNCHKWLSAPVGAGFLVARREVQALLQPLVVSWGWESRVPGISPYQDYFEWIGTDDPSAFLSVPAAIDFQQQHDWATVRAKCHAALVEATTRIIAFTHLPATTPDDALWWEQMRAIPIPAQPNITSEALQQCLFARYHIEVPIIEWHDQRFIRISLQAYNSPRDIDQLVQALKTLLFTDEKSQVIH